jgi:hypothetical protein
MLRTTVMVGLHALGICLAYATDLLITYERLTQCFQTARFGAAASSALAAGLALGYNVDAAARCNLLKPEEAERHEILSRLTSIESKLDSFTPPPAAPAAMLPWTKATLERVLFTQEEIDASVTRLAAEIDAAYVDAGEEEFVVVGLLSGCFIFIADLTRKVIQRFSTHRCACNTLPLATTVRMNDQIDSH